MLDLLLDTLLDAAKVAPFLLLTYLAMEYLEHKMGAKTEGFMRRAGRFGPLVGAAAGAVPQCGFSAAAASLYAGRLVSLGTLLAVFLSTSDEMLPIMLSARAPAAVIFKILGLKVLLGAAIGLLIDTALRRRKSQTAEADAIGVICDREGCHCESHSIWRSAIHHTAQVLVFLLLISFALNLALYFIGEDVLSAVILDRPFLGVILSGLVGLIPNCAASVVVTTLYLEGLISFGAVMSGLLVSAGVGLLVLFRINRRRMRENWGIVGLLLGSGVVCGLLFDFLHIVM